MRIEDKYRIASFPLKLIVQEAIDFRDAPILLLEKDAIGNIYLSYLIYEEEDREMRAYVQVSDKRLDEVLKGIISLKKAYAKAENGHIYIAEYELKSGEIIRNFILPSYEFDKTELIAPSYKIN